MKSTNKMLCLVNLPNGTTFGIQCDPKAIGQKCLEEVCKNLGFTCETEYFGLVECNKETSPFTVIGSSASGGTNNSGTCTRYYEWINLRNPLGQHGNTGQPYSLAFRVKFWVPAHLILQESVRNIFYMQAKSDLLDGRLQAPDWDSAARLAALLAQGDEIKFDQNALNCDDPDEHRNSITNTIHNGYADNDCSSIVSTSDMTAVGCVSLGSLSSQKDSMGKSKKRKLSKQKLSLDDDDESDNDTGVVREYSPLHVYEDYVIHVEDGVDPMPANFLRQIAIEHSKLVKTSSKSAKYWLLQSIFKLNGFGEETFSGIRMPSSSGHQTSSISRNRSTSETADWSDYVKTRASPSCHDNTSAQRCDISVGPHGLLITTPDEQTRIPFSAASSATPYKRNFRLVYLSEANEHEEIELKLARPRMAIALYRSITEKHAFYSCETVGSDVTKQFIRDFKGTIASMFNVYTKLGKLYVFDIQRTYREVYDHARRVLHAKGIDVASTSLLNATNKTAIDSIDSFAPLGMEFGTRGVTECSTSTSASADDALHKMEKEVAERISEAITCRICMDQEIDTSFTPCGHITSCHSCAEKCETCPLCRAKITCVNKIYLPMELRSTALNIFNGSHATSEHSD
ncbi:E3 ubiquitin-protein ligase MYLIP [Sitodiplosis mosellana]|uniref:E3 ubiquitin-protein ligase MYLIP n=1 Tax=Sitodiplosis mosellana TaxID=263140 RepID=UPI002444EEC6|nr:E3 ubiquitin-protein ligase MYLIP [Sitodiplosis mosellana]